MRLFVEYYCWSLQTTSHVSIHLNRLTFSECFTQPWSAFSWMNQKPSSNMSFKLLENPALLTVFHIFVCVCYFSVCCALFKKIFFLFQWDFSTKYYRYLALNLRWAFCLSVASWNNILVLPECSLKTPASVILLQAVIPPLQDSGFCIFSNNLLLFYLVFISLHTQKKKKLYSYYSTPGFIIETYLKYSSHDFKSWWISLPIIV